MYTAIYPIGKDGLTLEKLDGRQVLDADGKVLYFVDGGIIRAKQSQEMFPSSVTGFSKYIVKNWSYETSNVEELYGQALAMLKKHCTPKVEYSMDGYVDAFVGDTFRIEDTEFHPPLYLEARVTELEICTSYLPNSKITFDNYTELSSEISQTLLDKVEKALSESIVSVTTEYYASTSATELEGGTWNESRPPWNNTNYIWSRTKSITKSGKVTYSNPSCIQGNSGSSGDDAILLYIDSSNGTTFKNSSVATIFTVSLYVGGNVIENSTALKKTFGDQAHLRWLIKRYGETEFSEIPSNDSRLNDEGFIFTLSAKDIRFKAVFNCELNI